MFTARLLQTADHNTITFAPAFRSRLFRRRAAMRCNADVENEYSMTVSPMTAALASLADMRTSCPEVAALSGLILAAAEPGSSIPDAVLSVPASADKKLTVTVEPTVSSDNHAAPETAPSVPPTTVEESAIKPKTQPLANRGGGGHHAAAQVTPRLEHQRRSPLPRLSPAVRTR